jgi:DNA-binding HxlR family transcriptional regulator
MAQIPDDVNDLEMIRGTRAALTLLSSKWAVEVLYVLAAGRRRYTELVVEVGEVPRKTLTQRLRELERAGLVAREAYAEVPPRVEYALTPLGWTLTEPLMALYEWSVRHPNSAAA